MKIVIAIMIMTVVLVAGCTMYDDTDSFNNEIDSMRNRCETGGGTFTTMLCCKNVPSLPNTCVIGACGCSPENSRSTYYCECGAGKCWDGSSCVNQ